jgi:hypothetical protein
MGYTREPLSGSTHGRGIKVVATATAGTTIHTGQASTTLTDVVTLYAYNSNTASETLTLEWGGTTAPDDNMVFAVPAGATIPIVADLIIRNSLVIKAFSTTANKVVIFGFVNVEA